MSPAIRDSIAFERMRLDPTARSGAMVVVLVLLILTIVMAGSTLGLVGIPVLGLLLGQIVCTGSLDGFDYQFTRFQSRLDVLRGRWIAAALVGAPILACIGAGALLFQRSHALVATLLWLGGYLLAASMLRPPGTKGSPWLGWLVIVVCFGPFLLSTAGSLEPARLARLDIFLEYPLVLLFGAATLRAWRRIEFQ